MAHKLSMDVKNQIAKLASEGLTPYQIEKRLGVTWATARRWSKRDAAALTREEREALKFLDEEPAKKYVCQTCKAAFKSSSGCHYHVKHNPRHTLANFHPKSKGAHNGTIRTRNNKNNGAAVVSSETRNEDALIAYIYGRTQAQVEYLAQRAGLPIADITSRVGLLLQRSANR